MSPTIDRRGALALMGLTLGAAAWPSLAAAKAETDKRLVVFILRGGMDGLGAAPAYGDPDFEVARAGLAGSKPGQAGGPLALDSTFALHQNLVGLHGLYGAGELTVIHAAATPYRDRSHFDGQNVLECGATRPYGLDTGWINRAIQGLDGAPGRVMGVALNSHTPLAMRGPAPINSWSPSLTPTPQADTIKRVAALYSRTDPTLAAAFARAEVANGVAAQTGYQDGPVALMTAAAKFLSAPDGPRVAMVETTGWDTHAGQAGPYGALSTNLTALDRAVMALKTGMGPAWRDTVVMVASEFGRTVAMNGTSGTDHGAGGVFFLAGGAVKGGRVLADWPGLKPAQRLDGRDLKPTTDFRSAAKGVLRDHLGIEGPKLDAVFQDAMAARPTDGLIRG